MALAPAAAAALDPPPGPWPQPATLAQSLARSPVPLPRSVPPPAHPPPADLAAPPAHPAAAATRQDRQDGCSDLGGPVTDGRVAEAGVASAAVDARVARSGAPAVGFGARARQPDPARPLALVVGRGQSGQARACEPGDVGPGAQAAGRASAHEEIARDPARDIGQLGESIAAVEAEYAPRLAEPVVQRMMEIPAVGPVVALTTYAGRGRSRPVPRRQPAGSSLHGARAMGTLER